MRKLNREAVTAFIVVDMLTRGVFFDSRSAYSLPVSKSQVTRAFKALQAAEVVTRTRARKKYILTDQFLETLRQEITRDMPRGAFIRYPDLSVFDVSGVGSWSGEELEAYVTRLRQRWMLRKGVS